ncbi:hypothetical protein F4779DRAFT_542848 [Xylariaceae sp. FL0662B]|nr:hypothetical protein F4779DRAFT_542848 [Xylariaceae sp. FL0662B]
MDEDHLDTYSIGEVYASSGIRRRNENGLVHEIDWALFEFHDDRLPLDNLIPRVASVRGSRSMYSVGDLHPTEVVPARSLPGLEVQCIARTSGLQTGQIMPALASVKIYGRTSPSHTYQVTGRSAASSQSYGLPATEELVKLHRRSRNPLGVPGDSGAWVIDRPHGRVCGHVLAWSERKQVAYICPMEVLLLDIAETLDATEVRLPGGDAIVRFAHHKTVLEVSDLDDDDDDDGDGDDDDDWSRAESDDDDNAARFQPASGSKYQSQSQGELTRAQSVKGSRRSQRTATESVRPAREKRKGEAGEGQSFDDPDVSAVTREVREKMHLQEAGHGMR